MYIEKMAKLMQIVKDENVVVSLLESSVQHICDNFSSLVFSENRNVIMSFYGNDPDQADYNNGEKHRYKLALDAVNEINDIYISHGLDPFFSGNIASRYELQNLARDISVELFERRRNKQCESKIQCSEDV